MSVKIKIRLMKEKDLEKLSEIYTEVYRVFNAGEKWTKKSSYELLRYWLKRQPDLAFVAEHNGEIVGGFTAGIKPWWDGNHLVDGEIFVHPKHQKIGIGTLLSRAMFREAVKKYNANVWDAHTFKKHDFPLKWYQNLGFKEVKGWVIISGNIRKALKKLR